MTAADPASPSPEDPGAAAPANRPPQQQSLSLARLAPFLIFLCALALRLWGITWALPNAERAFSYHPDESVVVGHSALMDPFRFQVTPPNNFYNYGSLALLLNAAAIRTGRAIGFLPTPEAPLPLPFYAPGELLVARLITALLGAGTCLFLFGAGRRLYGTGAGVAAALLYAVAPLAVQHGHFATVDVPATFFIAGSLFFAARYLTADAERRLDLLWAGLWAGLAAATKYNALLVVLAAAAAWALRRPRGPFTGPVVLAGGTLTGFLIGCPSVLWNASALMSGVQFEAQHVREGHGDLFTGTAPGLIYHLIFNLRWGLGIPLLLVTLIALGVALARRRPADLVPLAFAVPYYLLVGLAEVKFARYMLPIFPSLLLLSGALLYGWNDRSRVAARVLTALVALGGAYALLFSAGLDTVMNQPDPRDQAAAFIRSTAASDPQASVGFESGPWYYSPPLGPLLQHPWPAVAQQSARENTAIRLVPAQILEQDGRRVPKEWGAPLLRETQPSLMVLSEIKYDPALRTKNPEALEFLDMAASLYTGRQVFANPIKVFGLPLVKETEVQGLPMQNLPHDMLYTNPNTVVLTR